ncbi:CopG family transcriptional regulator [Mycolicibacter senuensis]|uniref:ribbon-helix-helix domain-containing protein n=1 Tax=Mycolicibacter senuensis TaxID=386913 RepID=UPI000DCBEF5F|nr:CopG family transcriptional regulator [Mycolicibacter senuensis]RAV00495.1 antitoxin [Mycolicibacter senuensis]
MSRLEHRLQILLDDERHRRITAAARERGVSVATVVREAIDRGLAGPGERRKAAGQYILDAPDMDVPEPAELKQELDAVRGRRG